MKTRTAILLLTIFSAIALNAKAQIVNMESQRFHRDTTGWSGSLNGNLSINDYGRQVFAANVYAHAQYQNKKSLYLLLGNYGFLKGAGQSFIDNKFLHFRYNYKLNSYLRWEAFVQVQNNVITKIQSRFLAGTGPRFKVSGTKEFHLYIASLVMHETEKEKDKPQSDNLWRSSSYISFTYLPGENSELITTAYYQPVFFDGKDYRLLSEVKYKIKAGKRISVNLNWNYQYDSKPATDVRKSTYNFSTGVELDL